jgi:macrolide transport system ATP-binding/permease protein
MKTNPPAIAAWLVRFRVPVADREFVLGDLDEGFQARVHRYGAAAARRWYWREALMVWLARWNHLKPTDEPAFRGDGIMQTLFQDLHWAARVLRARTVSSLAIVVTLALAIGANSTIFSWINRVLLNPLPAVDSRSLYEFEQVTPLGPFSFSYPDYVDVRKHATKVLLAGRDEYAVSLATGNGEVERVWGEIVTDNFFDVLQVRPFLGRTFIASDADPAANPVMLISYFLWQRRFGSDPAIAGKSVRMNEHVFTIVGVTPPGFTGSVMGLQLEVFVPMSTVQWIMPGGNRLERRGNHWFKGIARLQDGATAAQARDEMAAAARALMEIVPEYKDLKLTLTPLADSENGGIAILRPVLLALMLVVALILLIACANIGNLLLASASSRGREIAIRLSMGASRARLFRQLFTEALVLGVVGAGAGLVLTRFTAGLLSRFTPPSDFPISMDVQLDYRVVLFTMIVTLAATFLFGLLPALRLSRLQLSADMKESSAGAGSRNRMRNCLVVTQVALSLALLVCAGLCMVSLRRIQSFDAGFNKDGVLLASIDLFPAGYDAARGSQALSNLLDELKGIPGVTSYTLARHVPLGFSGINSSSIDVEGQTAKKDAFDVVSFTPVGPGYLGMMNIPLVAGRDILEADRRDAPPVAVISETMATRYWPGENAVDKHFRFATNAPWITVVGVARDMKWREVKERNRPFVYLPVLQSFHPSTVVHIRTAGDPIALAPAVREAVRHAIPNAPVFGVRTLARHVGASTFQQTLASNLLGVFGLMALTLSAVGLYGVLAFLVSQRTREIGIRVAVGAQPGDVFRMVLRQGLVLTAIGTGIGIAAAYGLGVAMSSLLFGVKPSDPMIISAGAGVLLVTAIVASVIPARRATRVDPAVALRCE